MPTVEVPNVGEVDFPDSMSQEDIEGVLRKQYLSPEQSKFQPERIPTDPLERASLNFQQAGMATAPVNAGEQPIDIGGTKIMPTEGVQFPRVIAPPEAGNVEKTATGLYNLATGIPNFALSKEGLITLIAPELLGAKIASPIIKGIYSVLTAKQAGEALGKASVTHDPQDIVEGGGAAALAPFMALHGTLPEAPQPIQGPIAQGALLRTPAGAPLPRAEIPEQIQTVPPDRAAQIEKLMNKEATASYEPARPEKPTVPATPPEPERNLTMAAEAKAERDAMIKVVRDSEAKTTREVQKLFPEMNRQQAAILRDDSWLRFNPKDFSPATVLDKPKETTTTPGQPVTTPEAGESAPVVAGAPKPIEAPVEPTVTERPKATTSDILGFIESEADKARARLKAKERSTTFGSGPLHELPNIRDYAIIGAAKIARGAVDFAHWSAEMVKEFGDRIKPHLENLFKASQAANAEHTGIVERVRSVLNEAELPSKAITKGISSQVGRSIEAGAKAGERLAFNEVAPKIGDLEQKLNDSISKAKALSVYFSGQEKGGKAGRRAATAELGLADKWLEADANRVRQSLTELVGGLPLEERGRFVKAIANATKRPPLIGGDPASMYRNAANVSARIGDRIEEVHKNDTIQEIRDTVSKSLKSPGVDIGYKSRLLDAMRRVGMTKPTEATVSALKATRDYLARMQASGKDVEIPKEVLDSLEVLEKTPIRDMPIGVLEALRDKVNQLDQLGRLKVKSRKQVWEIEKANKLNELSGENTNPLNERPEFVPQPGEQRTVTMKVRNWINRQLNTGSMVDKALLPIDALFDLLGDAKGGYRGWLFKNVRNPLDLGFNEAQAARDNLTAPLERIIKENNFGEREAERIGVYAAVAQDGGLERLIEMGVKPETIDSILKNITPEELKAYGEMRKAMDSTLPDIQKLMHELYNIEVKPVPEYFPMPRDWNRFEPEPAPVKGPKFGQDMDFDELSGWKQMLGDFLSPKTSKTERGFTIERKPDATTPIKLNAFDVFFQHMNDVTYLLKTQRDLKQIGEIVRDDKFASKYGKVGQNIVTSWLDTVARQGKIGGFRRIPFLDELRRRTSAGVIGFRLASQFVHLSNVPLAIWRAGGPQWYKAGLGETLSKRGQDFLKKNFAETFTRGGGEPALVEASQSDLSVFGKTVIPKSITKASFAIARQIDRYNSQASTLGIYLRLISEKGEDAAHYDTIPVDKEAQARALVLSRRAVASPLPKDVSSSLSRGAITGGNISVGRTIFQFQNIFQDQWSNVRHDLARAGIIEKNPKLAATAFVALAATILSEMGIRETSKAIIDSATGNNKKKKDEDIQSKIALEAARRIPFGGQITSQILYGESGVPSLDSAVNVSKAIHSVAVANKDATKEKALIKTASGVAQLAGVPGASQIGDIIQKSR